MGGGGGISHLITYMKSDNLVLAKTIRHWTSLPENDITP